ncbi:MAG: dihydrofolate reductase [Propionibacteriaceae bacterium]|jgi:dihydrofolate reductase|nr:dihydrofolate reductase [Propionibacteriaceae bacterium]
MTWSLTAIAAVGRNGVIGDGSGMLWHLPADFARFKARTMGGLMLMGRSTFESIGRSLPGRLTVVMSRNPAWALAHRSASVLVAPDLLAAAAMLAAHRDRRWWVCGGGEIYRQWWPYTTELDHTTVPFSPDGSVHFPLIDPASWELTGSEAGDGFEVEHFHRRDDGAALALERLVTDAG